MFGLDDIVAFAHDVESVLEAVRDRRLAIDGDLISLLLRCGDHIAGLVETALEGAPDRERCGDGAALQRQLRDYLSLTTPPPPLPSSYAGAVGSDGDGAPTGWHISLRCGGDLLRDGMDPLSILGYVSTLGELRGVTTRYEHMPEAVAMDPETCYLEFEIDLVTEQGKMEIEDAFEFVRAGSDLHITPLDNGEADAPGREDSDAGRRPLGEMPVSGAPMAPTRRSWKIGSPVKDDAREVFRKRAI